MDDKERMITNGELLEKVNTTNEILKRVESKVDTYAKESINPQVFELRMAEVNSNLATNAKDILELRTLFNSYMGSERKAKDTQRSKKFGYLMAFLIAVIGTATGVFIGWLLTRR
jgi:hypothetical protein